MLVNPNLCSGKTYELQIKFYFRDNSKYERGNGYNVEATGKNQRNKERVAYKKTSWEACMLYDIGQRATLYTLWTKVTIIDRLHKFTHCDR